MLSAVTAAVRTRRARETSRLLWRLAPASAAGILLLTVAVRWNRASPAIPLGVLAGVCLTWALIAYARRHVDHVSDETAAAIDDEVRLEGELRSATWFASHSADDPWAQFHLQRAANRFESIDFAQYYPTVRAPRARVATGVMIAAAVVLAVVFPQRPRAGSPASDTLLTPVVRKVPAIAVEGVPPDLPQDLEDLLAAIENGTLTSPRPADAALLDTLKNLQSIKDPKALAALARALAADPSRLDDKTTMKDLADRTKRDAAMTPASEVRDALDQLAKKLSNPESDMDSAGFEKSEEAQPNGGVDLAGLSQSARDASAIAGIGMIAVAKQDSAQSDAPPGVGAGGASSSPNGGGTMPEIAAALRHEVVEANEDDVSGDVHSDERRKTERGSAATAFSRTTAGRSDDSRAVAPPPVPETRRAGIQTYFTRKQ